MERTAERVRLWATTITAVAAAAAAIAGLLHYAGTTATVALGGGAVSLLLAWVLQQAIRVRRTVEAVHYHLAPNGHENDLPADLRGRPVREVLARMTQRLEAGNQRFGDIEASIAAHLAEHAALARPVSTAPRVAGQE